LAHPLRSLGLRPEAPVAVALERSLDTLVGLLGVLKAGGVYVPLDPSFPQASLAYVLEDTGAPLVVTRSGLVPRLGAAAPRLVLLDGDTALPRAGTGAPPRPATA